MTAQVAPTKKNKKRPILVGIGALIILCCSCMVISSTLEKMGLLPPTATPTLTSIPTETPLPTQTTTPLPPTAAPEPTVTLSPIEGLKAGAIEILSNKPERLTAFEWAESEKFLYIEFAISDNFTAGLIVIGIQSDIADMLRLVAQSGLLPEYQDVTISGKFPLVDKFGNTTDEIVITASYTRATIEKINWDNFLYTNVLDIADTLYIHPALQELMLEAEN
jgi:hypothetical protein